MSIPVFIPTLSRVRRFSSGDDNTILGILGTIWKEVDVLFPKIQGIEFTQLSLRSLVSDP
jgi:hypothetical protein